MASKTKKIIRNLHQVPLNLRFGSRKDPYHITLQRRGSTGDYIEVPSDITDHPDFSRNLGLSFEIISTAEAKKIQYEDRAMRTATEADRAFRLERMEDKATAIGSIDDKGNVLRMDVNPTRSTATGTQDNPVPVERPAAAVEEGDTPPVSPELPSFGGVDRSDKSTVTRKKK